jgi:glycosyltransferase involved in cell wall biosynthesis
MRESPTLLEGVPVVGNGRRLVIVSPCVPHPAQGASAVLFYWYIAGLKAAGYQILSVLLLEQEPDRLELETYRSLLEDDSFQTTVIVRPNSIRAGLFAIRIEKSVQQAVAAVCDRFHPEVVLSFDLRCAWAASRCAGRAKIAWLGDLNFQTTWYHAIYATKERLRSIWTLPLFLVLSHYWKRPYRLALANCSRVVVASKSSEKILRRLGVEARYLPYPWPADKPHPRRLPSKPTLVFCGNFEALGSRSSFHALIKDVYPALFDVYGAQGSCVKICGRGRLPGWAETEFRSRPEFEVLGFAPALEPILSECHALIVPIEVPVGNRSRILTALAQKLLVIAHSNTALGNPDLKDGENCYLADTAAKLVDRVRRAVADPQTSERIGRRGFELYAEKFSPAHAVTFLVNEISRFHQQSYKN